MLFDLSFLFGRFHLVNFTRRGWADDDFVGMADMWAGLDNEHDLGTGLIYVGY